jgi:Ca-activated chloride channel family protein
MWTFSEPLYFTLLVSLPLLMWWWLRQSRAALRYPGTQPLDGLPHGRSRIARWGGVILRALALLLLVVALAGPRWPDTDSRIPTEGIAIQMVLDVSGSMKEPDFEWQKQSITRIEAVKRVFRLFVGGGSGPNGETLEGRPNDLIGLIVFAERPETVCPLTLSHSVLLRLLDAEEPRAEETNIGDALALALYRLKDAPVRRKVLVLLTDGYHNTPAKEALKPRQAAQLAANLKVPVPIYAIDAGHESSLAGESAAERAQAAQVLQQLAKMTGGRYFPAGDVQGLLTACREIDRIERQPIESFQYRRFHEAYPWFGLGSFVFLMMVHTLELTVWRRVP